MLCVFALYIHMYMNKLVCVNSDLKQVRSYCKYLSDLSYFSSNFSYNSSHSKASCSVLLFFIATC